ncbi:hypothetical protein AAFF_G00022850 [Aldrovandia affinis]|uniref:Uncharacterized protein n=1 Tax=Aldrovandia affinis TaxID=143900 RepID=A0AAD7WZB7_9TELE|nr:hypothetical protein AAFF_G00022850 [Aldrovandia affinis]
MSRQVLIKEMAAQIEVKTGEGVRAGVVGGRLHLSPLADSSNKSPIEAPSCTQGPLILAPEPSKPVPGPKPRLTPKPFAVEKNPTIRPIPAPKPLTKPRPEPTRPASYKPDPPNTPKPAPAKPAHASTHRPVSTTPKQPTPISLKPSPMPTLAPTPRPVVQSRKSAPLLSPGEPAKLTVLVEAVRPQAWGPPVPPAAEWSGTTQQEEERERMEGREKAGASIVRAKSMGFLNQAGREDERPVGRGGGDGVSDVAVPMRPQARGSRPRPVSAIFLPAPAQTESPGPAPPSRWVGRRPISSDLTSRFESIGLSLHRRVGKADSKENTPERGREEDGGPARRKEKEKGAELAPSALGPERKLKPSVPDQRDEKKEQEEKEEEKSGGSIKRRISLLFDSSLSVGLPASGVDSHPSAQPIPETDIPLGVKQRIKKLTEDTPPAQIPSPKSPFKPRPLPSDLTKRFSAEKPVELSSLSPSSLEREGSRGHQQHGSEAHGKVEDSTIGLSDQAREVEEERSVFQFPQDQPAYISTDQSGVSAEERRAESEAQEASPSGGVQTVRAALFENVVERHSVQVVEEGGVAPGRDDGQPQRSASMRRRKDLDGGQFGGQVATFTDAVAPAPAPASPLRVEHVFDTVPVVGERAVVESVPSAQLEGKAMTLRSRRSGVDKPGRTEQVEERPPQPQTLRDPKHEATPATAGQAPRYLRVGGLKKWGGEEMERKREGQEEVERGRRGETERQMQVESERLREWEREREEVGAPKRLKMLEGEDLPPKPRATYFALTGQMQEPLLLEDSADGTRATEVPLDDSSLRSGRWGAQGPLRRNPSLDAAYETERQRAMDRERDAARREEAMSPLRPRVLDLDSVSLGNRQAMSPQASDGGGGGRLQPSPRAEDHYRLAILDIDSFRSQAQPAAPGEVFPVAGIQGPDAGPAVRHQPHASEPEGGRASAPGGHVGRPGPVWSPSQQDFWEQRGPNTPPGSGKVAGGWAAPEPPQKPANKPSLEQLLLRHEERLAAPSLVPERAGLGCPPKRRLPPPPGQHPLPGGSPPEPASPNLTARVTSTPFPPRPLSLPGGPRTLLLQQPRSREAIQGPGGDSKALRLRT